MGLVGSHAAADALPSAIANVTAVFANLFIVFFLPWSPFMSREACGFPRSNPSTLDRRALAAAALPQEFERLAYSVPLMRHFALREPHFDAAQRTAQHQLVEPSEMS